MDTTLPNLLTPSEAADRLALPVRSLERLARAGELPAVRLPGNLLAFDPGDLMRWLAARKTHTPEVLR
jgi:excisionase family DNA binding protein